KPLYTFVKDVDVGSVGGNSPAVSGRGPMVGPRGSIRGPLPKEIPLAKGWHEAQFYPSEQSLPSGFQIKEVEDVIGLTLVNDVGHTLYVFDGDVNKDKKICGTACEAWQPLAAPRLSTASGDFGTALRDDGIKQWTYKGRGLYTFAGDLTPV